MEAHVDWSTIIGLLSLVANILLAIISGFLGFLVRGMRDQVAKFDSQLGKVGESLIGLQKDDASMYTKIASVEVLVAGKYASRDELTAMARDIADLRTNVARLEARAGG